MWQQNFEIFVHFIVIFSFFHNWADSFFTQVSHLCDISVWTDKVLKHCFALYKNQYDNHSLITQSSTWNEW